MVFGWLFRRRKADIKDDERIEWEPAGNGMAKIYYSVVGNYSVSTTRATPELDCIVGRGFFCVPLVVLIADY